MSFDLEEFKLKLQPFGDLIYATSNDNIVEFVVENIQYLYAVSSFGEFTINHILPYYPKLLTLSMDKVRLKGAFFK
tara:strand:+ start:602 stop:829 length:228 start_codon:yes stop_codon:yes gene_type:complete